MEENKWTE